MKPALIACIAAFSCFLWCGQPQGLHDSTLIGLAAGATAPEFSMLDQFGQWRTVESLMGPQGMVLVFFRSADW